MSNNDNLARGQVELQVEAENQISRDVFPELWARYRVEITELYCNSSLTLEEIRDHMRQTQLFEASLKQWKNKLGEWGLGRYLTQLYAAHILRLHIQGERQGAKRRVFCFGKERSRHDITAYRRKSKPRRSERDLLETLADDDLVPACITHEDTVLDSRKPFSRRNSFSSTPYSRPSSSTRTGPMASTPSTVPGTSRTSWTSLHSSPAWSIINDGESLKVPAVDELPSHFEQDPDSEFGDDPSSGDRLRERLQELVPQFQTLAVNASQLGPINAATIVQPLVSPGPQHDKVECSPYFNGSTSISPVHHWTKDTMQQIPWETWTEALTVVLGGTENCAQLNSTSHTTYFLLHCLQGCMLRNQHQTSAAAAEFEAAMERFQDVLTYQFDECLSTLSSLVALFESYGQRMVAREILLLAVTALHARTQLLPSLEMDPLYETVMFMCQTQIPEYGTSGTYSLTTLEAVVDKLHEKYGDRSKLTLMARYNLAWAKLENRHVQEARSELLALKPATETVFGRWHLQSISCAATLARAHLHCQEFENASVLIEETVVFRIERVFSKSHPYYWEARYRQGTFMKYLSDSEQNPTTRFSIQEEAERILREVLLWRITILGFNSPRTNSTFRTLRELLETKGKFVEANTLHIWCTESCQKERQRLWGHCFVLTQH